MDHEVPQMKETFQLMGENYRPRLAIIIVKKRIHTRLFATGNSNNNSGRTTLENPPPGTVVDTDCVHKNWYDFFLVSQSVRHGKEFTTFVEVYRSMSILNVDTEDCIDYYYYLDDVGTVTPTHYHVV